MKVKNIQRINEAVLVLRNFIELSSQLLPYLVELKFAKKLSPEDEEDKGKIIDVYTNYAFDNQTSKLLMNSTILELIEKSFHTIVDGKDSKDKSKRQLLAFKKEHKRLKKNWIQIDAN